MRRILKSWECSSRREGAHLMRDRKGPRPPRDQTVRDVDWRDPDMMQNEDVSILHDAIFDPVSDVVATRRPRALRLVRTRDAHRPRVRRLASGAQGTVTVTSSNETTASVAVSAMPPLVTEAFTPDATIMPP